MDHLPGLWAGPLLAANHDNPLMEFTTTASAGIYLSIRKRRHTDSGRQVDGSPLRPYVQLVNALPARSQTGRNSSPGEAFVPACFAHVFDTHLAEPAISRGRGMNANRKKKRNKKDRLCASI